MPIKKSLYSSKELLRSLFIDIYVLLDRFSSSKTFRAHKLHYCSSRHKKLPLSDGVAEGETPFLALPTNPILIVPYSLFEGASLVSGGGALPPTDTACLLLPDGSLQPMAQAIQRPLAEKPRPPPTTFPSPPQPVTALTN